MPVKIGQITQRLQADIMRDGNVPMSELERNPIYKALIGRIAILEATIEAQAERIGDLTIAVHKLEDGE